MLSCKSTRGRYDGMDVRQLVSFLDPQKLFIEFEKLFDLREFEGSLERPPNGNCGVVVNLMKKFEFHGNERPIFRLNKKGRPFSTGRRKSESKPKELSVGKKEEKPRLSYSPSPIVQIKPKPTPPPSNINTNQIKTKSNQRHNTEITGKVNFLRIFNPETLRLKAKMRGRNLGQNKLHSKEGISNKSIGESINILVEKENIANFQKPMENNFISNLRIRRLSQKSDKSSKTPKAVNQVKVKETKFPSENEIPNKFPIPFFNFNRNPTPKASKNPSKSIANFLAELKKSRNSSKPPR